MVEPTSPRSSLQPCPPFVLVTGNPNKLVEARRIVGTGLRGVELDLPEIQSLDLTEVLRAKAEEAWRRLGRPLVVEETGLELEAMNGFPGPFVKWMLEAMGAEGIARLARSCGEVGVVARCALLYRHEAGSLIVEGTTRGELVLPPRGRGGYGWDPVFLPAGETKTYGELSAEDKDRLAHRGRAWRALMQELGAGPPTLPGR